MKYKNLTFFLVAIVLAAGVGSVSAHFSKNTSDATMANMSPSTSDANAVETNSVTIRNFAFSPASITVKVGTTVTWTNQDDVGHTITGNSGIGPASQVITKGQQYSYTYMTPGTYPYHCSIHTFIKGTVTVTN